MFRFTLILGSIFLMLSCVDNSNKNQAMDLNIEQEIQDRIKKINMYAELNDTSFIIPETVDKKVRELILLSKDIENLSASVNMSNDYFKSLAKQYNIDVAGFDMLDTGMHVNDIASALKQNEMIFFNHILLKTGSDAIPMNTAR